MSNVECIKYSNTYVVHNHIHALCESKGIKLEKYKKIDMKTANSVVSSNGLFSYKGKSDEGESVMIYMITEQSDHLKKSNFEKLINIGNIDRFIVIHPSSKKFKYTGDENIEFIPGDIVMKRNVPKMFKEYGMYYSILTPEEVEHELWTINKLKKEDLSRIEINSTECIYSKAKIGDVMRLTQPSDTSSGMTTQYRLVVESFGVVN